MRRLLATVCLALAAACGQTSSDSAGAAGAPPAAAGEPNGSAGVAVSLGGSGGSGNAGNAGKAASQGGAGNATTTGGSGGASGAAGQATACDRAPRAAAPGDEIADLDHVGFGDCEGVTLAQVLAQIRTLRPDLSDITILYRKFTDGDGSFIYAFQRPDGGFAVAFKRGSGDCPAGCTQNDYFYFETADACTVAAVGESHLVDGCYPPGQLPKWGVPGTPPPSQICEASLDAGDISGQYLLPTCGLVRACTTAGEKPDERPLSGPVSLTVTQDPSDLSHGSVMLERTGEPLLDGQQFAATFQRVGFTVSEKHSGATSACVDEWSLELSYDFEGFGARHLEFFKAQTPDCAGNPGDYCKGQISTDLGSPIVP